MIWPRRTKWLRRTDNVQRSAPPLRAQSPLSLSTVAKSTSDTTDRLSQRRPMGVPWRCPVRVATCQPLRHVSVMSILCPSVSRCLEGSPRLHINHRPRAFSSLPFSPSPLITSSSLRALHATYSGPQDRRADGALFRISQGRPTTTRVFWNTLGLGIRD